MLTIPNTGTPIYHDLPNTEEKYDVSFVGSNKVSNSDIDRIYERTAAIGIGNLDMYKDILKKRRENLCYLMEEFKKFRPYMVTIEKEPYEEIGPHAFPIIIQQQAKFSRNQFADYLEKKGIDTRTLFSSMPTQCPGFRFLGYEVGEFPNAEYIGNNGLHIGVNQEMEQGHIDYFIDTVDRFLFENS